MISRRWFMGLLGGAAASPAVGTVIACVRFIQSQPNDDLYSRSPMMNALPSVSFRGVPLEFDPPVLPKGPWMLDFTECYFFKAPHDGAR